MTARDDLGAAATRIRADPLVRNSFFLMTTTVLTAACGFFFWLVVARLYPVEEVGTATSLLSTLPLLSYFSLVGMSSSMVRWLPTMQRRSEFVSSALFTVGVAGLLVALGFGVVAPLVSPPLGFLTHEALNLAAFAAFAVFAVLALLMNSVFVALRSAKFNLLINGVVVGVVKIALPFLFVWGGAMGIVTASGLASCIAAVLSLWVIRNRLGIPVRWAFRPALLRDTVRYSLSTYVSGNLNLVPLLVIPMVLLGQLGPEIAAAYFIAFQIATVINSAAFAVGESLFAEGAHQDEALRALMMRSAALMALVIVPAALVVILLAEPVLGVFGAAYAAAHDTLVVLALSAAPVAFHTWAAFLLKITDRLTGLTVSQLVFAAGTVVLVLLAVPHGPVWVAAAWGAGNLLAALTAIVSFGATRRNRHRFQRPRRSPAAEKGAV